MLGGARALLQRDFRELAERGYEGITAFPITEDMMKWKAEIEGLQNSIWQGLIFEVTINFTPDYNFVPPAVRFVTIPFHPNVDPDTGEPCIDFLNNPGKWNPRYMLSSILLALQVMLSNPVTENPVNVEAAHMLSNDPSMYQIVLQRLFQGSLQLGGSYPLLPPRSHELIRPSRVISFDDYHKTWCGIATSKATERYRKPLLEDPNFMGQYSKWKKMDLQCSEEWKLKFTAARSRGTREHRVSRSITPSGERTHLFPTPIEELPTESQPDIDHVAETHETEEVWKDKESAYDYYKYNSMEEEVDDLIAWTNTLNTDALED